MTIVSPCVGLCKLDEATGLCLGCARDGDEIAGWGATTQVARAAVWAALPDRFARLGVTCQRLPWDTEEIRTFVVSTLRDKAGTWVMGVVGAVAEFAARPDAQVVVETDESEVCATTSGGSLRFVIDDAVRALTFDPPGTPPDRQRIVLAVKRERGRLPVTEAVADLGPDAGAVMPGDRGQRLFDLGLGRKEARFCTRCAPGAALEAMVAATGRSLFDAMPMLGPALLAQSPTRVVDSALGRIEVSTPIPPPGGRSPAGPHTHLLPDHLATGRAMPTGMDLPRAYLPGAIFYPAG